ncbi:MAG: hypothetical protein JJU29_02255 [Verrucomicrobia bacterium]|nr:hypothetical protein [Verrucomicrobiota bacterium]MCH8513358.1 hypothetical protein [Kiritimatiellia bacterium]
MSVPLDQSYPAFWEGKALSLQRLVNAGWWWTHFTRGFTVGAVLAACWLVGARLYGLDARWAWGALGLWALVWGGWSFRLARGKFIDVRAAYSRLDVARGLNHRLVSAMDGVGPWPRPQRDLRNPLQWNLQPALIPPLLWLLLLASAIWIPVGSPASGEAFARQEPAAWSEISTFLEEIKQEELVDEEALKSLEEQLAALREKPEDSWYRQGSLETTDQLRTEVEREARKMMQNLRQTAALMEAADAARDSMSPDVRDRMQEALQEMLAELGQGTLPLTEEMLSQLRQIDFSQLDQLSSEDLKKIEETLSGQCDALGQCMVAAGMPGEDGEPGFGEGEEGEDGIALLMAMLGEQPSGRPGEDGGSAPMSLGDTAPEAEARNPFALSNEDMTRAATGDLLALGEGEHDDEVPKISRTGGGIAAPGGEGEAVWRENVLPAEAKILQQYFQ